VTNKNKTKKQTPHFRTYSQRALCNLPQTLHGVDLVVPVTKGVISFLIQRVVFRLDALAKALSVIAMATWLAGWLAGWLGGWLSHSGIVSKRLNLSENFFDHLKAQTL